MKNGLNLHMGTGRYFGVRYYAADALSRPADRHEHYVIQAGPGVVNVLPDEMDDLIVRLVEFRDGHKEVSTHG